MRSKHNNQGMLGKDASNRGKAIGNNQPAQQNNERVMQQELKHNDNNMVVAGMVTAMAAATMVTTVAPAAVKTMAATAMLGGTDINH
jgi:hypothetical protein